MIDVLAFLGTQYLHHSPWAVAVDSLLPALRPFTWFTLGLASLIVSDRRFHTAR